MLNFLAIFTAKYGIIFIGIMAVTVGWSLPVTKRTGFILSLATAGVCSFILTNLARALYFDPRPFVVHNFTPLIPHAADNGFPSDHTVLGLTIAFALWRFSNKLGLIASFLALLIGISRIYVGLHSPLDITASIAIALVAVVLACVVAPKLINALENNAQNSSTKSPR